MKYTDNEIKNTITEFLGVEGKEFFENVKNEYGTVWARLDEDNDDDCVVCGPTHFTWTNEGRQIRNHILEKYPDIVNELGGDYGDFEEYMYTIVEEMFE